MDSIQGISNTSTTSLEVVGKTVGKDRQQSSPVGTNNVQNTNQISASDQPYTSLGKAARGKTDNVNTLLNEATANVKNRSVTSGFKGFLDKCANFFKKIGSLLNLCDSPEVETARKNTKAVKQETERLLHCFSIEHEETNAQLQRLQSHLKENGNRLNTTEIFTLKNKIVENGEVINMCGTRIGELKAKFEKTNDIDCQWHLQNAILDLTKLAKETHQLSLEIEKLLSHAHTPDIPHIRNIPDPDDSVPTLKNEQILSNTNEVFSEKTYNTYGKKSQASFETIQSKSTSKEVAEDLNIKRSPKTAEDASLARPNLKPSLQEKAKEILQQPKAQHTPTPFGTFVFGRKKNAINHKTPLSETIPEVKNQNRNRQKTAKKQKTPEKPSGPWFPGNKVQTDASGNKTITHNTKLKEHYKTHDKF